MDPLRSDLCLLTRTLNRSELIPMVAGGYGLLLKAEYLEAEGLETLAPVRSPRATQDLDLVLRSEIVANPRQLGVLKAALEELEYRPVPGRENYQWQRTVRMAGREESVKVDLLGQIPEDLSRMSLRERRMRPHGFTGLHANPVREAAFVHIGALSLPVCDDGKAGLVQLPHPFSYMLLKLFAFEDRKRDESVDYGRHHAFDLYRIVGMLTDREWGEARGFRDEYRTAPIVREAAKLVKIRFGRDDGLGAIRLEEYLRAHSMDVPEGYPGSEFRADLHELWVA